MKQAKKLFALALVLSMAISLAVSAFAASANGDVTVTTGGDGTTTITVDGITIPTTTTVPTGSEVEENINGHTFNVYQIFSAQYAKDADGNDNTNELVGIKWGSAITDGTLVAKLTDGAFVTEYATITGQTIANPFAEIGTYEANVANLAINPSAYRLAQVVAEFAPDSAEAKAFARVVNQVIGSARACATIGEDETRVQVEEAGYYLMKDTTDVAGTDEVANISVVSMPEGGYLAPRSKVMVPQMEKEVIEFNDSAANAAVWGAIADHDLNDNVPFALTGTLPGNYNEYKYYEYRFVDSLSGGLVLNVDSVKIFMGDVDGVGTDVTALADKVVEAGNKSFTIGFANLKETLPGAHANSVFRVFYTAKLSAEGLVIGGNGNENEASLQFSNDPNYVGGGDPETPPPPPGETPKKKVTVFTFELDANKVDEDGAALEGAEFSLYKYYANEDADKPAGDPVVINEKPYYLVETITVGAGEAKNQFAFNGIDAGTYMLREDKAPMGYNKVDDVFFQVNAKETMDENGTKVIVSELLTDSIKDVNGEEIKDLKGNTLVIKAAEPTEGVLSTDIVNLKGVSLPSTGGIGTTIFYVVGGLLLVGAAVVLITKKRMQNAE